MRRRTRKQKKLDCGSKKGRNCINGMSAYSITQPFPIWDSIDLKLLICASVFQLLCWRRYFCMAIGDATFLFPLSIWAAAICDDDNATWTGRREPKSRSNTFSSLAPCFSFLLTPSAELGRQLSLKLWTSLLWLGPWLHPAPAPKQNVVVKGAECAHSLSFLSSLSI